MSNSMSENIMIEIEKFSGGFLERNAYVLLGDGRHMTLVKDISIGTYITTLNGILPITKIERYTKQDCQSCSDEFVYEPSIKIPVGFLIHSRDIIVPQKEFYIHPKQRILSGNTIHSITEIMKMFENDKDVIFESMSSEEYDEISYVKIYLPVKTFLVINGVWIESS
jgi:hypothetical protein